MTRTILFICLAAIIFFVLYELYTTMRFNRPRLCNEMMHLEKKKTLEVTKTVSDKEPGNPELEKGIYSVLTVEELGLLLKVQKDTGLLKNKNMKQVAKTIAECWHTKQKEHISWQYLYNSMSAADVGTIRNLEDKLIGMVNWLRKMRSGMK